MPVIRAGLPIAKVNVVVLGDNCVGDTPHTWRLFWLGRWVYMVKRWEIKGGEVDVSRDQVLQLLLVLVLWEVRKIVDKFARESLLLLTAFYESLLLLPRFCESLHCWYHCCA